MVVKRVGALSCAKIAAAVYFVIGVLVGAVISVAATAGVFVNNSGENAPLPMLFGAAAIVVFPIMYGCIGFIGIFIVASLYNALAGAIGGIEVEIE